MATTGMQETQVRPSPSALCDRCKVLEFNDKELGGLVLTSPQVGRYMSFRGMSSPIILPFNLHDTFPDLAILAASQCPLCSIVRSRIRKFRDIEWPSITELRITGISLQYNAHMRGPGPQLDFNAVGVIFGLGDEAEKLDYLLEFAIQAEHTDPCASWLRIRRRPVTSDPLSTDGVARMRQLLSTSAAEVDCDGEGAYLPTRLIDVGHNQRDPRLILSKNNPTCITGHSSRDARYAALSYCWGSPAEARSQLKTTQDTLNAHLNKIALPSLPQTVWDAVMVCRELEIQFLWVDALCIIQGDAEDWERESMEMANVYSNAFITIGALQGDSCNSGFLARDPTCPAVEIPFQSVLDPSISGRFSIVPIPYSSRAGPHGILPYITEEEMDDEEIDLDVEEIELGGSDQEEENDILEHKSFEVLDVSQDHIHPTVYATAASDDAADHDIAPSIWNTRAWTFQETRLSRRLLLFGSYMFHLALRSHIESEDGMVSRPKVFWGPQIKNNTRNVYGGQGDLGKTDHRRNRWDWPDPAYSEAHRDWRLIVEYYSSRSLTYFADVLPAISAIARRSTHKCRGKYLAGLWSDDLQYELLWTKAEAPTSSQWSQADYTAPSWSWASCPGSVQFAENIDMLYPDFELLSAETTTNLDPFGRVSGGHISLLTKVCEIPASKLVGTELQTLSGEYLADVWFDYNSAPFPTSGQQGSHDGYLKPGILMARISTAMAPRHMTGGEDGAVVRGLLVVATGRDGEYRRIGIFYSEGIDLGGRKFWDCIDPALLRIV